MVGNWILNIYELVNVTGDWVGWSMAQMVSSQPLTTESKVQVQVSPWRICGGQNGTRWISLQVLHIFLVIIIPPVPHSHSFLYHRYCIIFAVDSNIELNLTDMTRLCFYAVWLHHEQVKSLCWKIINDIFSLYFCHFNNNPTSVLPYLQKSPWPYQVAYVDLYALFL